jgi:hypothetical protein
MTEPPTRDVQGIFDQLLVERGGAAVLGVSGCAIVRAAAVVLAAADLDVKAAATAVALLEQLPQAKPVQQPAASRSAYDLGLLNDRELDGLHYLLSRCEGLARGSRPPRPDRHLRGGRAETPREYRFRELGRRWDAVEHEGCRVSAGEARELGEAIISLLPCTNGVPLLTIPDLWPEFFRYVQHQRKRDEATMAAVAPTPAAPAANGKVVPLHERIGNRPPYRREEPSWP